MKSKHNYFKNVFFSMTFATLSILIVTLIVLYVQFSHSAKSYISDTNLRFIENAVQTVNHKIENSKNSMLGYYTSNFGVALLTQNPVGVNEELNALNSIDRALIQDANIFSSYFINGYKDRVYTTGSEISISQEEAFFDNRVFEILKNDKPTINDVYIREIPVSKYNNETVTVCTIFIADYSQKHLNKVGVINLAITDIFDIFSVIQEKDYLQSNYVIASEETGVIYSQLFDPELLEVPKSELSSLILKSEKEDLKINGSDFFITPYEDPYTGWTYYSIMSSNAVVDSFRIYHITFALIVIVATIIGLFLNFGLSRFLYLPIQNLSKQAAALLKDKNSTYNKNDLEFLANKISDASVSLNFLVSYKESTLSSIKNSFLKTSFEQRKLSDNKFFAECGNKEIDFNKNDDLCLVSVAWFNNKDREDYKDETSLIQFALVNVFCELTQDSYYVECFFDMQQNINFVCKAKHQESEDVRTTLQSMQIIFNDQFHLSLICLVSHKTQSPSELFNSFAEFQKIVEWHVFFEKADIVDEDNIQVSHLKKSFCNDFTFDILEEKIRNKDEQSAVKDIEDYFNQLEDYTYAAVLASIGMFSVEFIRLLEKIEKTIIVEINLDYNQIYMSLIHTKSISSTKRIVLNTLHSLCTRPDTENDFVLMSITSKAIDFIHSNYSDYNLSSKSIALDNHLSVATLNRGFKMKTGLSVSGYIKDYRINKSKELLMNSNLPVERIASKVGFENTKYFYSLFKKEYGISPANFRMLRSEND